MRIRGRQQCVQHAHTLRAVASAPWPYQRGVWGIPRSSVEAGIEAGVELVASRICMLCGWSA
eukprot:scaffold3058_cov134-Isochrysis_galbana.AAC.5